LLIAKRLMKQAQASLVATHMAEEADIFGRLLTEPAAREAFGAFLEKRKPNFENL
ncbi:MAG: enoyl-CoA hydratase, partial [Betaproteobacteria bacterium]|nr:enoyl-CoA hydratase [Betaproteobacteria bacterium]